MLKSEHELICSQCGDNFDEDQRTPRMLPECGHTFCTQCIKKLLKNDVLKCPDDNIVYYNKKTFLNFPKNFALLKLLNKKNNSDLSHVQSKRNLLSENDRNEELVLNNSSKMDKSIENSTNSSEKTAKQLLKQVKNNTSSPKMAISCFENTATSMAIINDSLDNISVGKPCLFNMSPKQNHLLKKDPSKNSLNFMSIQVNESNFSNFKPIESTMLNKEQYNNDNKEQNNDEQNMCLLHMKKLELICLTDKSKICSKCALFGSHKNHEIAEEEELLKKVTIKAEKLLELLQKMEDLKSSENIEFRELPFLKENLNNKKNEFLDLIQRKFENIYKILQNNQNMLRKSIFQGVDILEKALLSYERAHLGDFFYSLENWKIKSKQLLQILSDKTERDEIPFELLDSEIDILGAKLLEKMERISLPPFAMIKTSIKNFNLSSNDQVFKSIENNFFNLDFNIPERLANFNFDYNLINFEETSNFLENEAYSLSLDAEKKCLSLLSFDAKSIAPEKKQKNLNNDDNNKKNIQKNIDLSNSIDSITDNCIKTIKKNKSYENLTKDNQEFYNQENLQTPINSKKIGAHGLSPQSEDLKNIFKIHDFKDKIIDLNRISRNSSIHTSEEKKQENKEVELRKKSLTVKSFSKFKIPDKSREIYEKLQKDKLETVDLNNAELGDKLIGVFAELFSVSKNIKFIKLMKNKITDDGVNILVESILKNDKIQMINLNYNSFTDKSLDTLSKLLGPKNSGIKKIYLLNNNIAAAKGKNFVKEAKNFDVEIYL